MVKADICSIQNLLHQISSVLRVRNINSSIEIFVIFILYLLKYDNSKIKYVATKHRQELMEDLKKVYKASTIEEAALEFENFKTTWNKKYEKVVASWENNWLELTTYFSFPVEIRKLIYTTNTVEGYHRQLRKVTKTKTAYPTDNSLRKIIYLATMDVMKKWLKPHPSWLECKGQFKIIFGERFKEALSLTH